MIEMGICPRCCRKQKLPWQKICSDCSLREHDLFIKMQIENGATETSNESSVYCPHCGEKITWEDVDSDIFFKEDQENIDCPFCRKAFHIVTEIRYLYSTSQDLDDC